MILSRFRLSAFFPARSPRITHRSRLMGVLSIAVCLISPASVLANETGSELRMRSDNTVALLQQPGPAGDLPIRLQLHGIENLRLTPDEPDLETDAVELKKQAQTQYLAAKFKKQEKVVRQFVDLAWAEAARRDQLEPELLIAIMQKESAFRPKVQSRYGAQGLMQVVRRWHRDKLHPSESLFDPEVNVRVGADVLEEYLAQAGGNMERALRKYSGNARGYVNNIRKESRKLARIAEQAAGEALVAQG